MCQGILTPQVIALKLTNNNTYFTNLQKSLEKAAGGLWENIFNFLKSPHNYKWQIYLTVLKSEIFFIY